MTTVSDILNFFETLAPISMKMEWDKVGLNCGRHDKSVQTILLALDPFTHVCKEAKEIGADLLITHHALLWDAGFITDQDETGRNTLFLIENGIACINAHTNLDQAPGGVNDTLAAVLGLKDVEVIDPAGTDAHGNPYGLLRMGNYPATPLPTFLSHVKASLDCDGLRYVNSGKPVQRVAVGGGACGDGLYDAYRAGCDTFVTSDIKYHLFWSAKELGINLIDAGHFHTENPVISVLAQKIAVAFPEITVKISQSHRDCAEFY